MATIPDGAWAKCDECSSIIYRKDLLKSHMLCPSCGKHFRLEASLRLDLIMDKDTFSQYDRDMDSKNVLNFPQYSEKINKLQKQTGLNSAVITGQGMIGGQQTVIAVMDCRFLMGSMGQAVGEKITRAIERATDKGLPIIIFTASGGARMQEGIFSLMQMSKTSAALARHNEKGLLYISVITDPTTGGVSASFAMLGDIILAEPGALIGFAGRRVIEQTIGEKLPDDFQTAEFLLEHGFIDRIVSRNSLKDTLSKILTLHDYKQFRENDSYVSI